MLRRFRLPGLESIAEAGPAKLDEILASAAPQKLSIEQRLLLKSWLHGLRFSLNDLLVGLSSGEQLLAVPTSKTPTGITGPGR
jgi:hypothetical protein